MASKLKSLELDNWKSLKSLSLDFEDINVLIGPNGSGKSNLVQFFQMLNMMMTGNLQLLIGRSGGAGSILHYGAKNAILIDSKLTFTTENATDFYAFRLIHGAPDTFVFASENITYKLNDRAGDPFTKEFGAGHKESHLWEYKGQLDEVSAFVRNMLARVRYFQFHDTSNESHIRGTAREDNNRTLLHNGGNVAAVLLRLSREFPDAYREVVQRVRAGVPALKDFVLEPENGHLLLDWTDTHRGQRFGPHQLSDGSIRLIALHTLLALPPQMAPSVAVIDEPELGLFPRAVATLAEAIRSASSQCQIVLATQSNRLVRYLKPDSLICCAWKDGQSTVQRVSPADEFQFMDDYTLGDYIERNPNAGA
jgi:predicted ATPase